MSSLKKYNLLIVILIIATFLRFYHFTTTPPGLYPDEAIDGNNAVEVAQTGHFQSFYTEDNGREGLYVNTIAILFRWFNAPHEPWAIRLPAAIAGVLTVLGLYFLVTELFGEWPGLLSAFLLATSFWHINFSRIGFRAIMAPLFLTWAIYLLIKALRDNSQKTAMWYAVIAGIIYALGFYTYIAYRVTPLLFLLFIPFFKKYPGFWKRVGLFTIATFMVAAPIGLYFLGHPADFFGRTSQISVTNSGNPISHFAVNLWKTLLMLVIHGDENWRHNLSGAPELFLPVAILFLAGVALGLYSLRKTWKKKTWLHDAKNMFPAFGLLLVFFWFVLAILPAAASDEGIPHALRSILMLPPTLIIAALSGVWLYSIIKKLWSAKTVNIIVIAFLVATAGFAYVEYFVLWANNPNVAGAFNKDYVDIGMQINAVQPENRPKYVVVEAGGVMVRGFPMPAETTMFITDSFLPDGRAQKNIQYILPGQESLIVPNEPVFYIK